MVGQWNVVKLQSLDLSLAHSSILRVPSFLLGYLGVEFDNQMLICQLSSHLSEHLWKARWDGTQAGVL